MIDAITPIKSVVYNGSEIPIAKEESGYKYVRPSNWLPIPDMDGTQDEIYMLVGVENTPVETIQFDIKGTGTIDWGDGQSEAFSYSANTKVAHFYNFEDVKSTQQALIHIYGARNAITYFSATPSAQYTINNKDGDAVNNYYKPKIYQVSGNVASCDTHISNNLGYNYPIYLEIFEWATPFNNASLTYMFYGCYSLQYVVLPDTSNITNMSYMFCECRSLVEIPEFSTSQVTTMQSMFASCYSLTDANLSNFNTSRVTNMNLMFSGCKNLTKFDLAGWDTSNVTNMSSMFKGSSITNAPELDTHNVTNMESMFSGCAALTFVPLYDTSKVTNMVEMFNGCSALARIPRFDTEKVQESNIRFTSCFNLTKIPLMNFSSATSIYGIIAGSSVRVFPPFNTSNVTNMSSSFGLSALIKIYAIDCSKVTSLSQIFNFNSTGLQDVELYNLGAGNTSSMTVPFSYCTGMSKEALVKFFNSLATNTGRTRTLSLGSTLRNRLANCYVVPTGEYSTYTLATNDTTMVAGKTYYTWDEDTYEFNEFTGSEFEDGEVYFEVVTSNNIKYVIGESTDTGAMLALDWLTNVKGWTVT